MLSDMHTPTTIAESATFIMTAVPANRQARTRNHHYVEDLRHDSG